MLWVQQTYRAVLLYIYTAVSAQYGARGSGGQGTSPSQQAFALTHEAWLPFWDTFRQSGNKRELSAARNRRHAMFRCPLGDTGQLNYCGEPLLAMDS